MWQIIKEPNMSKRPIVHFEIPAKDRKQSAQFFADVFGWGFRHSEEPAPYTLIDTGNVGGGLPDADETYQPGHVILYIDSEDVEADLKKVEECGGKRLSDPFMVGEFGQMAFFADPTGNRLALWKELGQMGGD
jgi:predicted enzyme related to lactoylglutathione lyase